MNKVVLVGRLTRDPEVRSSSNGMQNARFSVAVNRNFKNKEGGYDADFISCVAFGRTAEFIGKYFKKGSMIGIEGRIQTGSFQGQDGQMHYTTEVVVDQVENLQPRDPNAPAGGYQQQPQAQPQYQQNPYQGYNNPTYGQAPMQPSYQQPSKPVEAPQSFDVNVADDDLPF